MEIRVLKTTKIPLKRIIVTKANNQVTPCSSLRDELEIVQNKNSIVFS
jgi:hypothetical protein